MSVSLWAYNPDICDGDYCPCDCDFCRKAYDREVVTDADDDEPDR